MTTRATGLRYDLSQDQCASVGCSRPVVTVRQTSNPTAFYGECLLCAQRIEADMAARRERMRATQDRRAHVAALLAHESSWALTNMCRALSIFAIFNSPEEAERLELAREELRRRRHAQRRATR
jgi:hypothetical protein